MKNRPTTTLFLLSSVDGKISTGGTDIFDVDRDFPRIGGIREGLSQYYDLERKTDLFSLNSGRVLAKVGFNEKNDGEVKKTPVSFIVIDNKPNLNHSGVQYLLKKGKKLFVVTTNKKHPVFDLKDNDNLEIIFYKGEIDFDDLFSIFKNKYGMKKITIQTGGTLNSIFLRKKLIDNISLVLAPVLIGGKDTATTVDGQSLRSLDDLKDIKSLKLLSCNVLKNSYIHLEYKVVNETKIV